MQGSLAQLEAVAREAICRVCAERPGRDACAVDAAGDCALFRHFPQVVDALRSVRSGDIYEVDAAMRREVCSICKHRESGAACTARRRRACALDAYLVVLVDVIEEAGGPTRMGRPGAGSPVPGSKTGKHSNRKLER